MGKSPAFQFYPNEWLGSPSVALMTPAEEGAYIRLLAYAWGNDDCGLNDDDNELASLSRLGEGWFAGGSAKIRKCFVTNNGRLYNERLLQEKKKQEEWVIKSKKGGKKSWQARKKEGEMTHKGWAKGGSQMVHTTDEPKPNSSFSFSSSFSNKEKDIKNTSRIEIIRSCSLLKDLILQNNPKALVNDTSWHNDCRLMFDRDKRTESDVEAVIRFAQADDFWKLNILSMRSLRKQYDRLFLKMRSNGKKPQKTEVLDIETAVAAKGVPNEKVCS